MKTGRKAKAAGVEDAPLAITAEKILLRTYISGASYRQVQRLADEAGQSAGAILDEIIASSDYRQPRDTSLATDADTARRGARDTMKTTVGELAAAIGEAIAARGIYLVRATKNGRRQLIADEAEEQGEGDEDLRLKTAISGHKKTTEKNSQGGTE